MQEELKPPRRVRVERRIYRNPAILATVVYIDNKEDKRKSPTLAGLRMGATGLEPVTPSLSSWCSPN
jgi:hypothetical protein